MTSFRLRLAWGSGTRAASGWATRSGTG